MKFSSYLGILVIIYQLGIWSFYHNTCTLQASHLISESRCKQEWILCVMVVRCLEQWTIIKSTNLATLPIIYIIFTAKLDTKQTHACNKHGLLSRDDMSNTFRKLTWIQMMFTWSCVFKPQSSDVFKWTYITISMWQIQKTRIWLTEYHSESFIPAKNKRDHKLLLGFEVMFSH